MDRCPGSKVRLAFLHCKARHHSIPFAEAPGAPKRINHIFFECNFLSDVGSGRGLCLLPGVPIAIDLGCHMNDHMVSFNMANPCNFASNIVGAAASSTTRPGRPNTTLPLTASGATLSSAT